MKKWYKRCSFGFVIFVILIFVWFVSDIIHMKLFVGGARILTKQVHINIEIDGQRFDDFFCFEDTGQFGDGHSKRLVLWIKSSESNYLREILIVDTTNRKILLPNSSDNCYKLICEKYLMQSNSGAYGVAFGDSKLDANDPEYQNTNGTISFNIPSNEFGIPSGRWTIQNSNEILEL